MFSVNGIMVNHAGQPVDDAGKVIDGGETQVSTTLQADLERAQLRIADLELQLAGESSGAETRTNNELRAALDEAGVQYDAKTNKAGLRALAAEYQV